jgi:hypothetical protein
MNKSNATIVLVHGAWRVQWFALTSVLRVLSRPGGILDIATSCKAMNASTRCKLEIQDKIAVIEEARVHHRCQDGITRTR